MTLNATTITIAMALCNAAWFVVNLRVENRIAKIEKRIGEKISEIKVSVAVIEGMRKVQDERHKDVLRRLHVLEAGHTA